MQTYAVAAISALIGIIAILRGPDLQFPFAMIVLSIAIGWLACGVRVLSVASPIMEFRYYGPVTGRVVEIDRSQTDALRVTLDRVWMDRVRPEKMPVRVRVSLRAKEEGHKPKPGEVVMLTAHLSAPQGPAEPDAFDFRRMAFFDQLGAVGYSTVPVMLWQHAEGGELPIDRLRSYLSGAMLAAMPSQAGAFATGAMTGDRSAIAQETVQDLRDSSLAHLLAISGMNLAFLIGFVFAFLRYGIALVPWLALRVNSKKVAAIASLGVAAFYLALSGANVATERAFIMVSVMLGAVLLDRKALTLRSVAIAGIILLIWKPESLLEPGFQMSFAATIALIAGFREVDRLVVVGRMPKWMRPVFTLVLSSLIGGFATAPYAAAHFNRFTDYGLIANILTVPIMGSIVMPAGAIAALLAPFGLAAIPLWAMEQGSRWILWAAHWVASWEGAVTAIPAPPAGVLSLITLAGAAAILCSGWWRGAALVPLLIAVGIWATGSRPDVLISSDGVLVGVLGTDGRALSVTRAGRFSAKSWLENDGDLATQAEASGRTAMQGPEGARIFELGPLRGAALKGRGAVDALASICDNVDLAVIAAEVSAPSTGCLVLDQTKLAETGALALYLTAEGVTVVATSDRQRIWSRPGTGKAGPEITVALKSAARRLDRRLALENGDQ
ncbi:ComEC/Rec2 family competence protein [Thioclava sp. FR2]|uniref:ComEC/Rec2 family competence protein n=1 Tax=Thioclava sp. FR2 TaxID=3445780 RepID=UPI003EBC5D5F